MDIHRPSGAQVCVALTQPSSESRLKIDFNEGQARLEVEQ
jgi:hypothetical protein